MYVVEFPDKKICDYLDSYEGEPGNVMLIFNHGLGDLINFLPIFQKLMETYPHWKFCIGTNAHRKLNAIWPEKIFSLPQNFRPLIDLYTFIFRIRYVEPFGKYMNRSKPYLCNELVVGLKDFEWKPFQRYDSIDYASNEVGVHFFGNTNQKNKSPDLELAENIWNTIEDFGLDPFEIHNTSFNQYDENGMKFLKFGASLRFEDPNLERIIEKITECSSFIGIDSGPFYLAGSILGYDRCIGLKKVWDFERYIPMEIKKVDINNFNPDDLKKYLEEIYG